MDLFLASLSDAAHELCYDFVFLVPYLTCAMPRLLDPSVLALCPWRGRLLADAPPPERLSLPYHRIICTYDAAPDARV